MPKAPGKAAFYAVAKGRVPGVYSTWDDCQRQVSGFTGNRHKKFSTLGEAQAYLRQHGVSVGGTPSLPPVSSLASSRPQNAPLGRNKTRGKPYEKPTAQEQSSSRGGGSSRWAALSKEVIQDESGWDVVYSDGACKGNGKPGSVAGVGVWWGVDDARNLAERCPGAQTNNRAELIAIVRVLETTPYTKKPLLIKTDSKYSISCFREWMPTWLKNGWKSSSGAPVKNAPLIRYLSALLDVRARMGQKIHLQYVKGHAGEEGNEGADWLANCGATMPELDERDWDPLIEGIDDLESTTSPVTKAGRATDGGMSQKELEEYAAGLADEDELSAEIAAC